MSIIDRIELWLVLLCDLLASLIGVVSFTALTPSWGLESAFWRAKRQAKRQAKRKI